MQKKFLFLFSFLIQLIIQTESIQKEGYNRSNFIEKKLDPTDLMPSGVNTNSFYFINNFNEIKNYLVNDETKINLDDSNNEKLDDIKPSIIINKNLVSNGLIKLNEKTESNLYTNYLQGSDNFLYLNLVKNSVSNIKNINQIKKNVENNFFLSLDSKISLNKILDQLNLVIGSNLGFIRRRQQKIIRTNPGVLSALNKGLKLSLNECKFQFKNRKWNCQINTKNKGIEVLSKIINKAYRETAYLTAIRSAGIAYSITKACSDGLIKTCSCDLKLNTNYFSNSPGQSLFLNSELPSNLESNYPMELDIKLGIKGIGGNSLPSFNDVQQEYTSDFKWTGCSDNINFSFQKTKQLLDGYLNYQTSHELRSLHENVILHNYEAGRMAVKENMILVCKCHGVSGTCTMRTCWRKLSSFRKISNFLKDRFDSALQVIPSHDNNFFEINEKNISPLTDLDLVYTETSPDFCKYNLDEGSLGTKDRICDPFKTDNLNSCDQLCCGRGYKKIKKTIKQNCDCQFQWCCNVVCKVCKKKVQIYVCN